MDRKLKRAWDIMNYIETLGEAAERGLVRAGSVLGVGRQGLGGCEKGPLSWVLV